MHIVLAGGGTGGSVTPLLAVREAILSQKPKTRFSFLGTPRGPERGMVSETDMLFYTIPSGKWRRYLSFRNFLDPFVTLFGFVKALSVLKKIKPNVVFSAGSFVSVPIAYAAWILGIPTVIHQQDVIVSLSNKLVAPIAKAITVAFEITQKDFPTGFGLLRSTPKRTKVFLTGNPVRAEIAAGDAAEARSIFGLESGLPTLLVVGGSSGAQGLNKIIFSAMPQLLRYFQVIHVTGPGQINPELRHARYHPFEFLRKEMPHALKIADLVVSRAGAATISELAICRKASILVPLPQTQQLYNAYYLYKKRAAMVVMQESIDPESLADNLRKLLFEQDILQTLKKEISRLMPPKAAEAVAKIIITHTFHD